MEELNLGDAISQLKVLKWQYDDVGELESDIQKEVREELIKSILETINAIEVPQLIKDFKRY